MNANEPVVVQAVVQIAYCCGRRMLVQHTEHTAAEDHVDRIQYCKCRVCGQTLKLPQVRLGLN
ncbi:MAG: hypothetical protein ABFD60_06955 [Bryobacteraceae bacterium]